MNWNDWYTDLMEIRRTETVKDGNLTRKERKVVCSGVPCRVYRSQDNGPDDDPDSSQCSENGQAGL